MIVSNFRSSANKPAFPPPRSPPPFSAYSSRPLTKEQPCNLSLRFGAQGWLPDPSRLPFCLSPLFLIQRSLRSAQKCPLLPATTDRFLARAWKRKGRGLARPRTTRMGPPALPRRRRRRFSAFSALVSLLSSLNILPTARESAHHRPVKGGAGCCLHLLEAKDNREASWLPALASLQSRGGCGAPPGQPKATAAIRGQSERSQGARLLVRRSGRLTSETEAGRLEGERALGRAVCPVDRPCSEAVYPSKSKRGPRCRRSTLPPWQPMSLPDICQPN